MPQLAGGRARLPHQLGPGVPVGRDGGGVGPRSRGSHRYSRDRHRRDPLAAREPVPARLPDRPDAQALAVDRPAPTCQDPAPVLPLVGRERTAALAFICSDMWKAYLKVVAKKAGHALHILDRFHIAKHMSDAIDQVRRAEVRSLRQRGRQPLLTKARWVLLKRKENQTPAQRARLRELLQHNLRAVRAMLLLNGSTTSGATGRSIGPGPSWTSGASKSCARASSR